MLGQCCDEWQAGNGNMSSVGCCFLSNTQVCWLSSLRHCFGFSSSSNWCLVLALLIFCMLLIDQLSRSQRDMFWQAFCDKWCVTVFSKRWHSPKEWIVLVLLGGLPADVTHLDFESFALTEWGHCKFDAFIEKSLTMNAMRKEKETPSFTTQANKWHKNQTVSTHFSV